MILIVLIIIIIISIIILIVVVTIIIIIVIIIMFSRIIFLNGCCYHYTQGLRGWMRPSGAVGRLVPGGAGLEEVLEDEDLGS